MCPCLALPLLNKSVCCPIYLAVLDSSNLIVFIPGLPFYFILLLLLLSLFVIIIFLMFTPFTLIGVLKQKRNGKIERDILSIQENYMSLRK